jgi:hypothetical protein
MDIICKNCQQLVSAKYCGQCGQAASTHKISSHFLWHDIQHGFFHIDKGLFYTLKELYTRPGFTIKEYLEGKRVKHFKPISLVIILAGIWGLLYHYLPSSDTHSVAENTTRTTLISKWLRDHYSIAELINMPFYALASFVVFRIYNYWEHLVINAFLIAQKIVIGILLLPILVSLKDDTAQKIASSMMTFISFLLIFWTNSQLFAVHSKLKVFALTVVVFAILFAETFVLKVILTNL